MPVLSLKDGFVSFVVAFDASAQGKKVYISVDMEGISGVIGDDQTRTWIRAPAWSMPEAYRVIRVL